MAFGNGLSEFAFGTPASTQQIQKFSPEQQQLMNQVGQQAFQGLQNTNLDYAPIANRLKKEYQTETVPNLISRFIANNGSGDPFSNTAIGSILQGGASDLAEKLAAGESGYNLNKYNTLLGGLNVGLQPQFESARFAAQPGFAQQFAPYAVDSYLKHLLSPTGTNKTESSTGQAPQQQQSGGFSDYVKQALGWLARIGLPIGGAALGGPGGAAAGGALGQAANQFLSPNQLSYQGATGQTPMKSPFEQRPSLQELLYQYRTGNAPVKSPFMQ